MKNKKSNSIYNSIKNNKILRNKFNRGNKRSVMLKTNTLMKDIEKVTNKWKDIPCLSFGRTLLKCPYYPEPSINSMQSIPKFQ